MRVVIAAAGTGGHINPGIAIANEIMKEDPESKIIFIGTDRGLEKDLVPRAGYELRQIDAYGIRRTINLDNIKRLYKTFKSIGNAKKILNEFKPDVVIGTGGYICVAVGKAAHKLHIPIIIHESNAFPGVATKMISRYSKVLVGFEDAKTRLPKAKNVVVTGNPSKIEKVEYSNEQKIDKLKSIGLNDNGIPTILIFGGSQGAKSLNDATIGIIENQSNKDYQIILAAGVGNYDNIKNELKLHNLDIENLKNAVILPYIYNMQEMMNISDLVVCRSGAMTITEIAILEKPAIFIPFPFATENHQEFNARVLEKVGAAKIILDKNLNSKILNDMINSIIKNHEELKNMGNNASKIAKKKVEKEIYNEIIKYLPN